MNPALDLLYRLVALAVCVYWARKAWRGYVEGKIMFVSDDWLDWSRWSRQEFSPGHHADPVLDADGRHGFRLCGSASSVRSSGGSRTAEHPHRRAGRVALAGRGQP